MWSGGTGTAGACVRYMTFGRPRSCRWLRYMKVLHTIRRRSYVHVGLRGRAGRRGLRGFCTAFAGDASTSFRRLRDGLSAVRREARKGTRRCRIFRESVAFLFLGLLTREKKGKEGGKMLRKKCNNGNATLLVKSRGNRGAAGAGIRADSGRKIGAEKPLFVVGGLSRKGSG